MSRIATAFSPPGVRAGCRSLAVAGLVGLAMAACSPSSVPTNQGDVAGQDPSGTAATATPSTPPAEQSDSAPAAGGETVGGDGSEIRLEGLTGQDVSQAGLSGELSCAFSVGDAAPLLLAMGDVASDAPAQGVVKVSGYVEPVRAPGGFDGMLRGGTFSGQGKTLLVTLTGEATGGGESPPRPATLEYQRADGASRRFDGRWQCGP